MYPGDSNPLMLVDVDDEDPPRQPLKAKKDNTAMKCILILTILINFMQSLIFISVRIIVDPG